MHCITKIQDPLTKTNYMRKLLGILSYVIQMAGD